MNISITTAIKAGFFGAIGFFIAQIVLVPVILVILLVFGVSLAGLGVGAAAVGHSATSPPPQTASRTPARWAEPAGYSAQR